MFAKRHFRRTVLIALVVLGLILGTPYLAATAFLYRAAQFLGERNPDAALRELQRAKLTGVRQAEMHFLSARAFRRKGDFPQFRRHLLAAKDLGYSEQRIQREDWLRLAQSGQLSRVEPKLAELLRNPDGDAPAICEAFVDGYFATYQFHRAFPILEAWEKDFPDDPQPHVFRGLYLDHGGVWMEAVSEYRKALELAPRRVDVRAMLAGALIPLHQHEEAIEHYRAALAEQPDDPGLLVGWGRCEWALGRKFEGRQLFERAISLDPNAVDGRKALGQLELADGNSGAALGHLEWVHERQPTDIETRYALAQALRAEGQVETAGEHFEFVTQAKEAILEINRLTEHVQSHPSDCEARLQVGTLLTKYQNPEHGAAWLRSVLEFCPDNQLAKDALRRYEAATTARTRMSSKSMPE